MKTQKTDIQGVEVLQYNMQGKWYTDVASRVKIAVQAPPETIRTDNRGFHVVKAEIVPMGDRYGYMVHVEYPIGSGVVCVGSDFIDMKDATGLAKAETSAIGRALSFHGIGLDDGSVASADEMVNMHNRDARQHQPAQPPAGKPDAYQSLIRTAVSYGVDQDYIDRLIPRYCESKGVYREAAIAMIAQNFTVAEHAINIILGSLGVPKDKMYAVLDRFKTKTKMTDTVNVVAALHDAKRRPELFTLLTDCMQEVA